MSAVFMSSPFLVTGHQALDPDDHAVCAAGNHLGEAEALLGRQVEAVCGPNGGWDLCVGRVCCELCHDYSPLTKLNMSRSVEPMNKPVSAFKQTTKSHRYVRKTKL